MVQKGKSTTVTRAQNKADPASEGPWLSIITAVLNAPIHLRTTLDFVQNANRDIEHIIVDGGSGAPTQSILKQARKNSARIISERDQGIYHAINKGLRMARGDYVWILHAGDTCSPYTLASLSSRLEKYASEPGVIYYSDCKLGGRIVTAPDHLSPAMNLYNLSIAHQSLIVSKQVYDKIGEYNEDFRIVSDHIWMRSAYKRGVPFRKLTDWCVELDDTGLSSGQTQETKRLFKREILQRTLIYYPFLSERISHNILDARRSGSARNELLRFADATSEERGCEPAIWHELQEALRDYVRIFAGDLS